MALGRVGIQTAQDLILGVILNLGGKLNKNINFLEDDP